MDTAIRQFHPKGELLEFTVPSSKSILNRALLLAAFGGGTAIAAGDYGEDTHALLGCLRALGLQTAESADGLRIHGTPARSGALYVGSAGTAARFLTAILAFRGGDYEMTASAQMSARPMGILGVLRGAGVRFDFHGEEDKFPFRMQSDGLQCERLEVNTDVSTQYASGLLLAAAVGTRPFTLSLTGSRTDGSYLKMTVALLEKFGAKVQTAGNDITVAPILSPPARFEAEPDLSAACYFYALALLFSCAVRVRGVHFQSMQGDLAFLRLLESKGVRLTDSDEGILADGRGVSSFSGFDADLHDFSDQALTVAALAPFATSPSLLRNIGHIRRQECDRMRAIEQNITALGGKAEIRGDDVFLAPAPIRGGVVQTYGDHRVAMAFALIGLKTGTVIIDDPACCRKTFANYFDILRNITE